MIITQLKTHFQRFNHFPNKKMQRIWCTTF